MLFLSRQKGLTLLAAAIFFTLLLPAGKTAIAGPLKQNPKEVSWHISARVVTFDNQRNLYIAEDDVIITGGSTRLEADYVEFSNKTKDAFAQGNVLLISGEDSISCNAMGINLETEIGHINKGVIYIQKENFYIHGENIRKTGKFTYDADRGSITSCPGDSPDWKITGKKIKVTVHGYGTASHAVLWAKKVPAVYTPFLMFPVKTQRQTGLLFPRITNSDRKGFEWEQPLFIAISDSSDATFYIDYMSDRGTKVAGEYRYVLDNNSKGSVFLDFLEDDKTDDGTEGTKFYSFASTPQRTNTDRFWFRMKHDQKLDNGFYAKLDIDIAGDEDYLQEFKDGFTGYDEVNEYFEREFGRGLDAYDTTIRANKLNISRSWSTYSFNMDALWYDNITARRQDTDDTTLQTLPALQFDASKQKIGASSFYYSLDSEYRAFYRQDTTAALVRGQRADIYPKFYRPMKLGRYFNFEPSAGFRQTVWHTQDFTDINGDSDDFRTRGIYDFGAELSTKLIRIFEPANFIGDKAKHEIIPKLEYAYTPNIIQDDLPSFDGLDRIGEKNLLTWSLTNHFISKKSFIDENDREITNYRNFAYFKLYQSYDIKKERDNESEPFTNIFLDSEFYPMEYFSLDLDLAWSPYDSHFKALNIGNTIRDNRGDSLRTELRYTSSLAETLYNRLELSLTDRLMAYCSLEQNLETKDTVETTAGFSYEKDCWTFQLFYSETDDDQSITFLINLHGIGEFGTK